ncbi:hypothetical protein Daesc_008766 [Daldinia eschscholtzii]|uniref:HNH nuclease domain-containing protein n=1 Tax=Daldinia eschscholtzii TaxID=292717 RepID=A0AAX6MCL6_9PEZI
MSPSPKVLVGSPLGSDERIEGRRKFYYVLDYLEAQDDSSKNQYSRPQLIRLTYEYALSEESRDNYLRAFFNALSLPIDSKENINVEEYRPKVFDFADYLLDDFFLPLTASAGKTARPSPTYHSAIQRVEEDIRTFVGTPDRISALRGDCLVRDRHRCVVSQRFDQVEAEIRFQKDGEDARDDGERALIEDPRSFDVLEVAHILPHSLTKPKASSRLDASREASLAILDMLDAGVTGLIEGTDIDKPRNAITLTHGLHHFFGNFKIFFEPLPDQPPHTYEIGSFLSTYTLRDPALPVTRTLHSADTCIIEPPSSRLLAVHCAVAHILKLSGAGDYIERLLRDAEEKGIQADGSTEVGRLVQLGLGGWLDGAVDI